MTDVLPTDALPSEPAITFADLGLAPALLQALKRLDYAAPTPIQAATIPTLLSGRDVLGQAQTGTGKTAAFALPILQKLDMADPRVQALVLVPTRELALQVAEAVHGYSADMGVVGVLAIYGGDPIHRQLTRLAGTVRVVVGTPGRVLDHLSRGTLKLDGVRIAVLDEADEMLRMGFAEDVDTILGKMPAQRQTALFSATLPDEIARIAQRHLRNPDTIAVAGQTRTVATVEQCYMVVEPQYRVEALARLLTVEEIDAALVFARTRAGCATLAEMLESRGFASEAMHGDMAQSARESVIRRLKNGQLRVVVATDVAARGLDVEQINLVVNVELPNDPAVYVHRIGRTGRAGRLGRSVLFVTPREQWKLRDLERFIGQKLQLLPAPTLRDVQAARTARFGREVKKIMADTDLTPFRPVLADLMGTDGNLADIAVALARMAWGDKPLPVVQAPEPVAAPQEARPQPVNRPESERRAPQETRPTQDSRPQADAGAQHEDRPAQEGRPAPRPAMRPDARPPLRPHGDLAVLSLGVGRRNGVLPRDIVGAIANEAGLPGHVIGSIDIRDNFSLVELPVAAVAQVMDRMRRAMICGRYLNIRVMTQEEAAPAPIATKGLQEVEARSPIAISAGKPAHKPRPATAKPRPAAPAGSAAPKRKKPPA